jgi:magnesium transporter
MLNCYRFTPGQQPRISHDVQSVRDGLVDESLYWVDLEDPTETEEEILWEIFDFHPLAIEDCIQEHQYPKVDDYGKYLFITIHGVDFGRSNGNIETTELDLFLSEKYIVTYHSRSLQSITQMQVRMREGALLSDASPAFLTYQILDALVKNYLPAIQDFEKKLSRIEEMIIKEPQQRIIDQIFDLKHELLNLKRIIGPQRDVLNRLSRSEFKLVSSAVSIYFRDVYDQIARYADLTESYRDVILLALDAYMSATSNRLNEVMRTLTLISTIFLPLTFITGLFGMNFSVIPWSAHPLGFYGTVFITMIAGTGMYLYFRFKKWV